MGKQREQNEHLWDQLLPEARELPPPRPPPRQGLGWGRGNTPRSWGSTSSHSGDRSPRLNAGENTWQLLLPKTSSPQTGNSSAVRELASPAAGNAVLPTDPCYFSCLCSSTPPFPFSFFSLSSLSWPSPEFLGRSTGREEIPGTALFLLSLPFCSHPSLTPLPSPTPSAFWLCHLPTLSLNGLMCKMGIRKPTLRDICEGRRRWRVSTCSSPVEGHSDTSSCSVWPGLAFLKSTDVPQPWGLSRW